MNALPSGVRKAAAVRGIALFFAAYAIGGWIALASYDWSIFPASYQAQQIFLSSHGVFLALSIVIAELARLFAHHSAIEASDDPAERAAMQRSRLKREWALALISGAAVIATAFVLSAMSPYDFSNGQPGLEPLAEFEMDRLSRRPSILVRTNERGLRDEPWSGRDDDAYRVVVVGDSLVFGSGITDQQQTLRYVLAELLEGEAEVFTVSYNGLNLDQEVDLIEAHVPVANANLVVVIHNIENDLMPVLPYYDGLIRMILFPLSFTSFVQSVDRYQGADDLAELPGQMARLQAATDRLASASARHGFDVLFVYARDDCPVPYYQPPREASRRFAYASLGRWDRSLTFPNDFHPTPAGVRWMAEQLVPLVRRVRDEPLAEGTPDPITHDFRVHCDSPLPAEPRPPAQPAAQDPAPPQDPVLPPESMSALLQALAPYAPGAPVRMGWTLDGIEVETGRAVVRLRQEETEVRLILRHPRHGGEATWQSAELAMSTEPEALPEGAQTALAALADRLMRANPRGLWITPGATP